MYFQTILFLKWVLHINHVWIILVPSTSKFHLQRLSHDRSASLVCRTSGKHGRCMEMELLAETGFISFQEADRMHTHLLCYKDLPAARAHLQAKPVSVSYIHTKYMHKVCSENDLQASNQLKTLLTSLWYLSSSKPDWQLNLKNKVQERG